MNDTTVTVNYKGTLKGGRVLGSMLQDEGLSVLADVELREGWTDNAARIVTEVWHVSDAGGIGHDVAVALIARRIERAVEKFRKRHPDEQVTIEDAGDE